MYIDNNTDITIEMLKKILSTNNTHINEVSIYEDNKKIGIVENINISTNKTSNKKHRKNKKKDNTLISDDLIYNFFKRNPDFLDNYIKDYLKKHLKIDYSSIPYGNYGGSSGINVDLLLMDDEDKIISKSKHSLHIPNFKKY